MRYELLIRYHARVWFAEPVSYDALAPHELAKALTSGRWQAQTVNHLDMGSGVLASRQRLASANGEWAIDLPGNSLDITYALLQGIEFQEFCQRAGAFLAAMTGAVGAKSSRLATVQEGLVGFSGSDRVKRMLTLPPIFQQTSPFEWDWRCASSIVRNIGGLDEPTNTIATVKQALSVRQDTKVELDRLRIDLDINTPVSPTTNSAPPRFDVEAVKEFFSASPEWHDALGREIMSMLGES